MRGAAEEEERSKLQLMYRAQRNQTFSAREGVRTVELVQP